MTDKLQSPSKLSITRHPNHYPHPPTLYRTVTHVMNSIPVCVHLSFVQRIGVESKFENRHTFKSISTPLRRISALKILFQFHSGNASIHSSSMTILRAQLRSSSYASMMKYICPHSGAIVQPISCSCKCFSIYSSTLPH